AQGWSSERGRLAGAGVLSAWWSVADGHRRRPDPRPTQPGELPRWPDDPGPRRRPAGNGPGGRGALDVGRGGGGGRGDDRRERDAGPDPPEHRGVGPVHVGGYARGLGIGEAVVPLGDIASTWSALGVASADILHVIDRTAVMSAPFDGDRLERAYEQMEAEAGRRLDEQDVATDRRQVDRYAELRYRSQIFEVEIEMPAGKLDEEALAGVADAFEERYELLYGSGTAFRAAGIEFVTARVRARGGIR